MGSVVMDINVAVVVRSSPTQYNSVAPFPPAAQYRCKWTVVCRALVSSAQSGSGVHTTAFACLLHMFPAPPFMPCSHLSQDVGRRETEPVLLIDSVLFSILSNLEI
jgi:hypothetical protein